MAEIRRRLQRHAQPDRRSYRPTGECERLLNWWSKCSGRLFFIDSALPKSLPLARFTFEESPHLTHRIGAVGPPTHARLLQALSDHRLAGGFHRSGADPPSIGQIPRVVHAVQVIG